MVAPKKLNFKMYQGATFSEVLRWESPIKGYANITAITKAAPAVVTAASHGIPAGWRAKIQNVIGMKEINSDDYQIVTAADTNTVTFGYINASGYTTYTSGGVLEYNIPENLSGYTGRMQLRAKVDSTTVIAEYTTENGNIVIDNTAKTVTILVSAADTAAYTFKTAVYSLELVSGSSVVPLITGTISLINEITR